MNADQRPMTADLTQVPLLAGWAIAAGVGLVAIGVSLVVIGLSPLQACFVAAVLFLVVGVILGLPGRIQGAPARPVGNAARQPDPWPAPTAAVTPPSAPDAAPDHVAVPVRLNGAGPADLSATSSPLAPGMSDAPRRPAGLPVARHGAADDLKRIKGVGPKLEQLCNSLGFYHFDQIAAWSADEIAWVDDNLEGFKGRVSRDGWVAQARILASGGTTEFAVRVDRGEVY